MSSKISMIPPCPICRKAGMKVKPETLAAMLKGDRLPPSLEGYNLCLSGDCDIVYFGQQLFYKKDVVVKVWFKETDPSVPVCYCKGVSEADIVEHITIRGCCNNIQDLQQHTGVNTGRACLTNNPAGT